MEFWNKNFQKFRLVLVFVAFFVFIFLGFAVAVLKLPFVLGADHIINISQTIWGVQFWSSVTFLGNKETIIAFSILLAGAFYFWKKRADITTLAVTIMGAELSGLVAKNLFQRIRPITALPDTSFSFPSGHAMLSMAFYGFLIYFIWKNIQSRPLKLGITAILVLAVCMIGYSRLYLGMHFLTDILGGYLLGFIWVRAGIIVDEKFWKNDHEPVV